MSQNHFGRALLQSTAIAGLVAGFSFGASAQTIMGGGSTLATPTYNSLYSAETTATGIQFNWTGKGSGPSQCAMLSNYGQAFTSAGGTVDLIASDAALSSAQYLLWENGGQCQATDYTNGAATNVNHHINPNGTTNSLNANGAGNLIQLPGFATPVTVALNWAGIRSGNGRLQMNDNALCGVFSGKITTTAGLLAGGGTLNAAGAPTAGSIGVVYRGDGSGTSFLFTNHLSGVCNASNSNFNVSGSGATALKATTAFSSLFTTVPSNFQGPTGSPGVQQGIVTSSTTGGTTLYLGYLSPDFTAIASSPTNAGSGVPSVVSLQNKNDSAFHLPSIGEVQSALNDPALGAPSANLSNPTAWGPTVKTPVSGYPIVGYTYLLLPQCFADASVGAAAAQYLGDLYSNSSYAATMNNGGFVPVLGSFTQAISDTFLSNNNSLNLDIQDPAVCGSAGGVVAGR